MDRDSCSQGVPVWAATTHCLFAAAVRHLLLMLVPQAAIFLVPILKDSSGPVALFLHPHCCEGDRHSLCCGHCAGQSGTLQGSDLFYFQALTPRALWLSRHISAQGTTRRVHVRHPQHIHQLFLLCSLTLQLVGHLAQIGNRL